MRRLLRLLFAFALTGCPAGPDKDPPNDTDTALDSGHTDTSESDTEETHTSESDTEETDTSPPSTDADGDGYVAEADGGDDCDDANAEIHPGAVEYCDAVDQDCDGATLAAGVCGQAADPEASGHLYIRSSYTLVVSSVVRDLTGDGQPDLEAISDDERVVYVFAGGALPAEPFTLTAGEAWATLDAYSAGNLDYVDDGGDVDGDGAADLLLGDELDGGALVRPGPLPGPGDISSVWVDGSTTYAGYIQTDRWEISMSGTDLDGDGGADFLAANSSAGALDRFPSDIHYQLYFGGEPDTRCDVRVDIGGEDSRAYRAAVIGDGDGDGFVEFAYWATGTTYIVSGADARLLCEAYTEDLAGAKIDGDAAYGVHESLGDWDGDGYPEWPLVNEVVNTGDTAVYLLSSTLAFSGEIDVAESPSSFVAPSTQEFEFADALDFDGDGTKDLVLTEDYGYQVRVIRGGEIPGPNEPLPERHLLFLHPEDGVVGAYMHGGDLDGDGYGDLLAWHGWSEEDPYFNLRVIRGFDAPWDDPKWWVK